MTGAVAGGRSVLLDAGVGSSPPNPIAAAVTAPATTAAEPITKVVRSGRSSAVLFLGIVIGQLVLNPTHGAWRRARRGGAVRRGDAAVRRLVTCRRRDIRKQSDGYRKNSSHGIEVYASLGDSSATEEVGR